MDLAFWLPVLGRLLVWRRLGPRRVAQAAKFVIGICRRICKMHLGLGSRNSRVECHSSAGWLLVQIQP